MFFFCLIVHYCWATTVVYLLIKCFFFFFNILYANEDIQQSHHTIVLLFSIKEHIFFSHLTLFLLDCCHRAWQCVHLKTNTSLAGCCRVPDIACCCDVDMRGPLIAQYLFFMMPDGASTDLITLVWHVNKHMRLPNVTTGMLQSQQ